MPRSAIVVGAGLCGLVAARELADAGLAVVVLDKGRAPGGRLATRRDGPARWDHGAQFLTARDPRFAEMVEDWVRAGVASEWCRGFGGATDGHVRLRGVPGMSAVGRWLARDLDVRTTSRVASIATGDGLGDPAIETVGGRPGPRGGPHWRVVIDADEGVAPGHAGDGRITTSVLEADALVLTPPVPQSLALLDAGGVALADDDRAALERVAYDPCLAVLADLDAPSALPAPGGLEPGGEPIGWIADNQAKGVSPVPTATIHATARWSAANFDRDRDEIARELLRAAAPLLRVGARNRRVHGWRYAKPAVLHDGPCRVARGLPPLVLAGDAFVAPRAEGAALSGLAAAVALLERMSSGRSS